ncbi:hypothetical protein SAMN05216312_12211 [Cohnella sp. OV330]|uniref:hypothetical protein n=1 Tax=Cohnella sp. OV330 TaxID=1855288 RepID=UPI0008E15FE9|nr:hypothetical protein [Cohnella sp. OV330]SFB62531.1 hypothetical protein SAMN05216312_12211 [Cohnella sp. OV330]
MQIGRKIYYDKATGNVIVDTGEREGGVIETTRDQDFESFQALKDRVPNTVGVLQLEYGQHAQDFMLTNGYRVDVSSEQPSLLFSYPDPQEPGQPPEYRPPLSAEVDGLKAENAQLRAELNQVKGDSADMTLLLLELYEANAPA